MLYVDPVATTASVIIATNLMLSQSSGSKAAEGKVCGSAGLAGEVRVVLTATCQIRPMLAWGLYVHCKRSTYHTLSKGCSLT